MEEQAFLRKVPGNVLSCIHAPKKRGSYFHPSTAISSEKDLAGTAGKMGKKNNSEIHQASFGLLIHPFFWQRLKRVEKRRGLKREGKKWIGSYSTFVRGGSKGEVYVLRGQKEKAPVEVRKDRGILAGTKCHNWGEQKRL